MAIVPTHNPPLEIGDNDDREFRRIPLLESIILEPAPQGLVLGYEVVCGKTIWAANQPKLFGLISRLAEKSAEFSLGHADPDLVEVLLRNLLSRQKRKKPCG